METVFTELIQNLYLPAWGAGIGISLAWLTHGKQWYRVASFICAVSWPGIVIGFFLHNQSMVREAADEFALTCATFAKQSLTRRGEPAKQIELEVRGSSFNDSFLVESAYAIARRLTDEHPGYDSVQLLVDGSIKRLSQERHSFQNSDTTSRTPLKYLIVLEFLEARSNEFSRPFRLQVRDRGTGDIIAEQQSWVYRSKGISVAGFPLWRQQTRTCPLLPAADFIRAVLPPEQMAR